MYISIIFIRKTSLTTIMIVYFFMHTILVIYFFVNLEDI
jgi:hypothetical protein